MATTKARTELTPEAVDAELAAATEARDALVARIKAGESVAPGALAAADDAVAMAELRRDLADTNAAERVEAERQAEVARILAEYADATIPGGPRATAVRLVELRDALAAAALEFAELAAPWVQLNEANRRRLANLRPLPDDVTVDGHRWTGLLRIGSTTWPTDRDLIGRLMADALADAISAAGVADTDVGRAIVRGAATGGGGRERTRARLTACAEGSL